MKTRLFLLLCFFTLPLYSQTKTFVREYTYTAGEADSKITSRAIALDQVKRILLEEIGVYLQSTFETTKEEKNHVLMELTKEQIQSVTAGVTETKILEEKWNGETYYIKASITVNTQDVSNNIARIANDQSKLKELEGATQRADSAYAEIEQLRKQLVAEKDENEKLKTQKEYATASNSISASDWFQKGYDAYEAKDLDNAILFYEKVIELDPKDADAYHNLGVAYHHKGEIDKAIPLFEKAIELNPKFSQAYYNLGVAYLKKGIDEKAIPILEKAIKVNPKYSDAYFALGVAYVHLGVVDGTKGNIRKAISLYEKAIKVNPKYSDAYVDLGDAYEDKGNLDKAISLYEEAIELDPGNSSAYYDLGDAYGEKGSTEKKIECLKKAAQLGNTSAQGWLNQNGYTW